jgi:phospholipid/cholesterol/gamma-HCH transport system permease protein
MSPALPLAAVGRTVLLSLAAIGRIAIYGGRVVGAMLRPPFYPREFLNALFQIGWLSLPVVGLTALFTGGALALQIYSGGRGSMPKAWCRRSWPSGWCANWARCWAG